MTITHHLEYLPDRAAMESMRLRLLPMKGSVDGPSAREPFDHLMESTPAAPGVAYAASSIGGVPGWWCLPGDAAPHSAILYFHGGGYVVGSARAYRHFAGQFAVRANPSSGEWNSKGSFCADVFPRPRPKPDEVTLRTLLDLYARFRTL